MLFILAIDPLQRLMDKATQEGVLQPIHHQAARTRVSMYADDAAIFLHPNREEVQTVHQILEAFGSASGLHINLSKCAVYPISSEGINIQEVMQPFPCEIQSFPCQYLGLPLSTKALTKTEIMPLIHKLARNLPAWKGKLLNKAGRLSLVNMVLSSIPTYHLTIFPLKKWAIKKIDKIRRNFFLERNRGSKCWSLPRKLEKG